MISSFWQPSEVIQQSMCDSELEDASRMNDLAIAKANGGCTFVPKMF